VVIRKLEMIVPPERILPHGLSRSPSSDSTVISDVPHDWLSFSWAGGGASSGRGHNGGRLQQTSRRGR